jgi:hypothetical protein
MMRMLRLVGVILLGLAGVAVAQAPPVEVPTVDWKSLIHWQVLVAGAVNCVAVIGVVQVLKGTIPYLRLRVPWLLPTLSLLIGPLLTSAQNALAAWLGWPIDLSPIIAVFTGGTGVALHQIKKQSESPEKRIAALQARVRASRHA